ncbi:MAG: glycosyltransferase family 2 protein [Patescibacteria group bacterium]
MTIALQLSCFNGARYLPTLFASLAKQTVQDWHLYVLDNASDAENAQMIREAVKNAGLPITLDRLEKNIGFAGAHNYLFAKHKDTSDVVQLLNDDAFLEPDYLEKVLSYLDTHATCAAVSGKILRWDYDHREEAHGGRTTIVDSLGLRRDWTGHVADRSAGQQDPIPGRTEPLPVFGVSGCLPLYRTAAVLSVSSWGTLFHPEFVIYKEDVDLAYRLQNAQYFAAVVPTAIAYHRRYLGSKPSLVASAKKAINENAYYSYRNHLWILIMHLRWRDLLWSRIGVWPYEAAKLLYWFVRQPSFVWKTWQETWRARASLREARDWMRERHRYGRSPVSLAPTRHRAHVAIIMVGHEDLNEECLHSIAVLRQASSLNIDIVVPDNRSTKYRANELVERELPGAWCLLRNGDYGYGRSNVRGAYQVEAEYYFILNPDTLIEDPLLVDRLYAYMRAHPDVGVTAPKIVYMDGRLQETCRRFPAWYMPFVQRTRLQHTAWGKRYAETFLMRDYDHATERDIDWAQGSALFIDASVWTRLLGYDHRYWMYYEDIDLCRRTHLLGKRVVYLPDAIVKHAHLKESAKIQSFLKNLLMNQMARAHIASWLKYLWKWKWARITYHASRIVQDPITIDHPTNR